MKNKQIVILAAGKSSRFYPFCGKTHKSMFPVCGKPIIGWTLEGLKKLGAENVLVIVGRNDKEITEYLKNYENIGVKPVYQDEPLGMANALLSAKSLLKDEFIVGFPHLVDENIFKQMIMEADGTGVKLLVDKTEEPWKYGVLSFKDNKPIGITEKPERGKEPSNVRASGCYILTREFVEFLENTENSEYQFELALDKFMKVHCIEAVLSKSKVLPCKYAWDVFSIKDYVLNNISGYISKKASVSKSAIIRGKVVVEDRAIISDFAVLEGPVYVGRDSTVGSYCILRGRSDLEDNSQIERYVDCARSIIGIGSHIHSGFIGDSIVGKSVRIGAGFIVANKRINRGIVSSIINRKEVSTNSIRSGVLIGDNVKMGVNVSTMPGVIIGNNSLVGPNTAVMESLQDNSIIYSKFRTNIRKKIL